MFSVTTSDHKSSKPKDCILIGSPPTDPGLFYVAIGHWWLLGLEKKKRILVPWLLWPKLGLHSLFATQAALQLWAVSVMCLTSSLKFWSANSNSGFGCSEFQLLRNPIPLGVCSLRLCTSSLFRSYTPWLKYRQVCFLHATRQWQSPDLACLVWWWQ